MTPLPEPELEDHEFELWGQNVRANFYTAAQLREYAAACVAQERERCIDWVALHGGSVEIEAAIRAGSAGTD